MMFQSYALFPHLDVAGNIAFGLKQEGMERRRRDARVAEMLALVQMSDYARRRPHELSGGQKQRVALARALAKMPKLLLLDEPLAALDRKLREETRLELIGIQERVGTTFLVVTHDQEEALGMASRIAVMNEGRVVQIGSAGGDLRAAQLALCRRFCRRGEFVRGRRSSPASTRWRWRWPGLRQPIPLPAADRSAGGHGGRAGGAAGEAAAVARARPKGFAHRGDRRVDRLSGRGLDRASARRGQALTLRAQMPSAEAAAYGRGDGLGELGAETPWCMPARSADLRRRMQRRSDRRLGVSLALATGGDADRAAVSVARGVFSAAARRSSRRSACRERRRDPALYAAV